MVTTKQKSSISARLFMLQPAFQLTVSEMQKLQSSRVFQLLSALPYLCAIPEKHQERASLAMMALYILAIRNGEPFYHTPEDNTDFRSRLREFWVHVEECDRPDVRDYAFALLEICEHANHQKDLAKDLAAGKYNPVQAGAWTTEMLQAQVSGAKKMEANLDPAILSEIHEIFDMDMSLLGFWGV